MRIHRLIAAGGVVVLSLTVAACQSKGGSSGAAPTTSSAAPPSTSAAAAPAPSSAAPAGAVRPARRRLVRPQAGRWRAGQPVRRASTQAAAAGSAAVTSDGSYSGTLSAIVCVGSGPTTTASFNAVFAGKPGTFPGNIGSTEFGFQGPDNTDFDSGFLNKALDTDGKGFVLDGIVAKDESGKTVTMHGTLVCP